MANRPSTARSEISSAISDDGYPSPLAQPTDRTTSTTPGPPPSPHGYSHFRGVTNPTNRSLRSPPPPSTSGGPSRPQSPESVTSRTHVPSITAQGFLRPMSSQRLQQQRLNSLRTSSRAKKTNPTPPPGTADGTIEEDDAQSVHSNRTGPYASLPKAHRRGISATTGYTESEPPDVHDQQFVAETENHYFQETSKSQKKASPSPLNLTNNLKFASAQDNATRSPHSFRSGFSIGSKRITEPPDHQQLPSARASPHYPDVLEEKRRMAQKSALGRNYEYFEGNTMFLFKGRLLNTRDRPINILTGLLIIIPTVLFYVFK